MKIIFATNNQHKADEIRAALPESFSIITLKEAGIDIDIPEPHDTLEANALEKANTIYNLGLAKYDIDGCFSEDTGLEVYSLQNEPGVHSARYAGADKTFDKNIEKLLHNLEGITARNARFRTVICLILNDEKRYFEGICEGEIIGEKRGSLGFGYDPVFVPHGSTKTFAEMTMEEKNRYSHRRKATDRLVAFLNGLNKNNIE